MEPTRSSNRTDRVAAIGLASWDRFLVLDRSPRPGSYAIVTHREEQSGGTTSNLCAALCRLGVSVTLAAAVGDDAEGQILLQDLAAEGCDVRHVRVKQGIPTDACFILVAPGEDGTDRTILWEQGARLQLGDPLPIDELFQHDLVVVDVDDPKLRQFLVDLPAHVAPRTQMIGPLVYLTELQPEQGLRLALQHDVIVGNDDELCYLAGTDQLDVAIERLRALMPLHVTRLAAISRGAEGCVIVTRRDITPVPAFEVPVVDTTGAGDAFAAGIVYGLLRRWEPARLGQFANAMGALAVRALGARAGLPTLPEVEAFIAASEARSPR
ncbi:carbohydrate kinase family protein [Thermomicrobiaceae bacterium CFH 74404]|uniref:Carbohydrate kinase family protein n=4 Tax=Thermomicrobia TaxID=189775 RepID=A0AA41WAW4_9BACT|nr:carbohydrate kinase family protein [Thermalbibacter longus]MCM8749141.1 carbohydrate kinase family protein [Thermalbibacter longus]